MKLIINAISDDFIRAVKAAQWLIEHPESKDAMIVMEGDAAFYVRRTKSGISVTRAA